MKKIAKFLCGIFITIFYGINCFAIKDCRYVTNENIINKISSHLNYGIIDDEYFSFKDEMCCDIRLRKMFFIVNEKNPNKAVISAPIFSSVRKFVGEILIPTTFKETNTIDDILEVMTTNSDSRFELGEVYYKHFFFNRESLDRDVEINMPSSDSESDKFFYRQLSECKLKDSFDNICLVFKNDEGTVFSEFTFEKSGKLKPFIQRSPSQKPNFFESLLSKVRESSYKKQGYELLTESSTKDTKLKSE